MVEVVVMARKMGAGVETETAEADLTSVAPVPGNLESWGEGDAVEGVTVDAHEANEGVETSMTETVET